MKKRFAFVVAALCAMALCLGLAGCGGGGYEKNFAGTWKLSGMETSGEASSSEDIAMLESLGISMFIELDEDMTAELDMMGEVMTGTWSAQSASECRVTIDGSVMDGTLDGDSLTFAADGEKMTFVRADESERASAAASGTALSEALESETATAEAGDESDASEAVTMDVVVADDDICKITVASKEADWAGDPGYNVVVENKTGKAISVTGEYGTFSVDGKMVEIWGSADVQPGMYAEEFFYFSSSDVPSIDAMVNVKGQIQVTDANSWDELATYSVEF